MTNQLSNKVYTDLRREIIAGQIAMGERLRETHLAMRLKVSRTPIREALQQLAVEGLVESDDQGFRATIYSAARVAEIYGCRALLESESARLVAQAGLNTEAQIELEQAVGFCDRLLADARALGTISDPEVRRAFLEQNNIFHSVLHAACPNRMLRELIDQVGDIPASIRNYFRFSDDQLFESHTAHRRILRALIARDGERAAAQMREHIWAARDRMDPAAFRKFTDSSSAIPVPAAGPEINRATSNEQGNDDEKQQIAG